MRALEFVKGHLIYNPVYTYKFQLKTMHITINIFLSFGPPKQWFWNSYFIDRVNHNTSDIGPFLMKFINHQTKNCKVCKTCSDEKSVCMNKIIRKVNLPEKVFTGFGCKDCLINPIVGNLYKCPICPFHLSCEKCEEIGKHDHHLIMTSSKINHF